MRKALAVTLGRFFLRAIDLVNGAAARVQIWLYLRSQVAVFFLARKLLGTEAHRALAAARLEQLGFEVIRDPAEISALLEPVQAGEVPKQGSMWN